MLIDLVSEANFHPPLNWTCIQWIVSDNVLLLSFVLALLIVMSVEHVEVNRVGIIISEQKQ